MNQTLDSFLKDPQIPDFKEVWGGTPHPDDLLLKESLHSHEKPFSDSLLNLFLTVRDVNKAAFAAAEGSDAQITQKAWSKPINAKGGLRGGGVMTLIRADHLEKSAVNISVVAGDKYPNIESEHAGKPFVAGGVSLISHPRNPFAPIAHMNVRCIQVGQGEERVTWIGGGGDLTPMVEFEEDTSSFHGVFKEVCARHRLGDYPKQKAWCDEYFTIPHYGEPRGVGGIFFDHQNVESDEDFAFIYDVGTSFATAYAEVLKRRLAMAYTDEDREKQFRWRGRYAEFNLAWDRGTRFGLMSGGNPEAIFASLPPIVKW